MQGNRNTTRENCFGFLNNYFIKKDGICRDWEIISSGDDQTRSGPMFVVAFPCGCLCSLYGRRWPLNANIACLVQAHK